MSCWRLCCTLSKASLSLERLDAPRHVCWNWSQFCDTRKLNPGLTYQKMVVLALEACQTLLRIICSSFLASPWGKRSPCYQARPLILRSAYVHLAKSQILTKSIALKTTCSLDVASHEEPLDDMLLRWWGTRAVNLLSHAKLPLLTPEP